MRILSALNGQLMLKHKKSPDRGFQELVEMFCTRNSIHGINNCIRKSVGLSERCTWCIVMTVTIIGMVYVSLILSQRYNEGRFQTVVDSTTTPVFSIVFPTVTICNMNRLNWKRFPAAKNRFLPKDANATQQDLFGKVLEAFDGMTFGNFDSLVNVSQEPLSLLNNVNITNAIAFMTWTCSEMFSNCMWRNQVFNCCEGFEIQKSENGLCYAFNGIQSGRSKNKNSTDPIFPLYNGMCGPRSGLRVKVLIRPQDHVPSNTEDKGLLVMTHEATVWQSIAYYVPSNTEATVEVSPIVYYFDNGTRRISSSLRQCVFDDERNSADFKSLPGYIYMIENCISQCHQEYLMQYCNCTLDMFYPPGDFPPCKASDYQCIYKNRDKFRSTMRENENKYIFDQYQGMTCKCFRNCYSLNYVTGVRPSYLPGNILGNSSYVYLDVHYIFYSFLLYRTSMVFGWVDLMVSFGGIAGLFLGCSLISGVEIIYFLVIDVPKFLYMRMKEYRKPKSLIQVNPWSEVLQPHRKVLNVNNIPPFLSK